MRKVRDKVTDNIEQHGVPLNDKMTLPYLKALRKVCESGVQC